ncbi:ribosome silencing factor [Apibacter muscae]|uniref:Ribosomal silencing factor RsfS n=1 Tax=Apibacter muscae TaxID=2509004 RepID=A0A563DGE5_9FLAO|nr:ribosome silencing factor [Apibacter muscae]TWP23853.1 ribosome silencing factor [Apibacter muscae]TWP29139.1 ribosome silencing factor [Apibacter muscae]TWP30280.1 ribosome silencing factor [Apibacter muscae]
MINTEVDKEVLLNAIVQGIEDVKGYDITILNLTQLENRISDYFIVCTGSSNTQVSAISDSIERNVRTSLKEKPWHVEGKDNLQWVLMDYVSIAVHIFQPEFREYYDLESLWGDVEVKKISVEN